MLHACPSGHRARLFLAGAAALSVPSAAAAAEGVTASLAVSATVERTCSVSVSPVAFGSVRPGEAREASGSLEVACTPGTAWTASADVGTGPGASHARRKMSGSRGQIAYSLYPAGERNPWGDGSGSSATIGDTGTGERRSYPIRGRISGGQDDLPSGEYSDLVTVTISY